MRIGTCNRCKRMNQLINVCVTRVKDWGEVCEDCFDAVGPLHKHTDVAVRKTPRDASPSLDNGVRALEGD